MSVVQAREVWSQQSVPQRRLLIEKLHGNVDEAENDWAALSPQLALALVNAMFPPPDAPAAAAVEQEPEEEDDDKPHRRGRRR